MTEDTETRWITAAVAICFGLALSGLTFAQPIEPPLSEETIRLQVVRDIILSQNATIQSQQVTIQRAIDRIQAGFVMPVQNPVDSVSPLASACQGGISGCVVQALVSGGTEAKEWIRALTPLGSYWANMKNTARQYDYQKFAATESRLSNADNNKTLQTAFGSLERVGTQPPAANPLPTTHIEVSGSGPTNIGSGNLNVGSQNPTNPTKVCTLIPATATTPARQDCQ